MLRFASALIILIVGVLPCAAQNLTRPAGSYRAVTPQIDQANPYDRNDAFSGYQPQQGRSAAIDRRMRSDSNR